MTSTNDKNAFVGKKPNKSIPVPDEFRRLTLARERDALVQHLEIETGCTVVPRWRHGKIYQFDIHGSGAGVGKSIQYLNHWISHAHVKSKDSSAWAKIPTFDVDQWYYDRVAEMEDDRTQMFKGAPPRPAENAPELPHAIVEWPENLHNYPITPQDVFGHKLKALDSLRVRDEVFITLLPKRGGLPQIEIVAFDLLNVEVAKEHLLTVLKRVHTDKLGLQKTRNMLMDEREGIEIVLEQAERWWPSRNDKIVPRLRHAPMMDTPGEFRREELHSTDLDSIQHLLTLALEDVRRKNGAYDFAVRLGCVALGSQTIRDDQVGKVLTKDAFRRDINSTVDLIVKKWAFNNQRGWEIYHKLIAANHLLEPTKSAGYFGYNPSSLKETRPMFRATWVFLDPSSSVTQPATPTRRPGRLAPMQQNVPNPPSTNSSSSMIVVQVDWTDDEDGLYEKSDIRFYSLGPGETAPKANMDINLMELIESRCWTFALESMTPISRSLVSPVLTSFADRVAMLPNYDMKSSKIFANWDKTPAIQKYLRNGRLDKIYSFGIQNTGYKVELTAMWYPQQNIPVWGLAIRHNEWSTHLAELERLPVGHQARWGNTVTTFLPDDGLTSVESEDEQALGMKGLALEDASKTPARDGIRILMEKIMKLSEITSSVSTSG